MKSMVFLKHFSSSGFSSSFFIFRISDYFFPSASVTRGGTENSGLDFQSPFFKGSQPL